MISDLLTNRVDKALTKLEGEEWDQSPSEWSSRTINFIKDNDISFLLDVHEEPLFIHNQRRERAQLISEFKTVQSSLNKFEIPFSLIKFPVVPKPIGDIDILIPSQVNRRSAFEDAGFQLDNRTEPHREAYTKEFDTGLITFDVHTRASWRRVEYIDSVHIVEQHITHTLPDATPCRVPRLEHDLLIIAAHSMFDKRSVSLFEALYGYYLIHERDVDLQLAVSIANRHNWEPIFTRFCEIVNIVGTEDKEMDLLSFPYHVPTRNVIKNRTWKVRCDARDGQITTVGRELVGYPQDIIVHIFEERLGVSMYPLFQTITKVKRAFTQQPR
jgi:hypothetical protein